MLDRPELSQLDDLDRAIIMALMNAPESTNAELAKRFSVAETTIGLRIRQLTKIGALRIVGVTDPVKAGYPLYAWILMHIRGRPHDEVAAELVKIPDIFSVSHIAGKRQIFATAMLADTHKLTELMSRKIGMTEGIEDIDVMLCLDLRRYSSSFKIIDPNQLSIADRMRDIHVSELGQKLDRLDQLLLAEFHNDARITYYELARRHKQPVSTIRLRSLRLEKRGLLSWVAVSDPRALGKTHAEIFLIKANYHRAQQVASRLLRLPDFNMVATTLGPYNVIAQAMYKSEAEAAHVASELIPKIPGVEYCESYATLKVWKSLLGWSKRQDVDIAPAVDEKVTSSRRRARRRKLAT